MRRSRLRLVAGILLLLGGVGGIATWWLPHHLLARYLRVTAVMGDDYRGQAAGAHLLPSGYALREVVVGRRDERGDVPLIRVQELRVRLEPLARRARVELDGLQLQLVAPGAGPAQLGAGVAWRRFLDELAPGFAVDQVRAADARLELHLPALESAPLQLDLRELTLAGLDARPSPGRPAPARIEVRGRMLGHARVELDGVFDPDAQMQRFNAELRIDALDLPRLDAYARYWRGIDFEAGRGTARLRFTAQDGRVRGRFVAVLDDVDVFDAREDFGRDGDGLLAAARELVAGGVAATRGRRLEVEQTLDARIELPEDNLEGLRAVLEIAFASLGPRD